MQIIFVNRPIYHNNQFGVEVWILLDLNCIIIKMAIKLRKLILSHQFILNHRILFFENLKLFIAPIFSCFNCSLFNMCFCSYNSPFYPIMKTPAYVNITTYYAGNHKCSICIFSRMSYRLNLFYCQLLV